MNSIRAFAPDSARDQFGQIAAHLALTGFGEHSRQLTEVRMREAAARTEMRQAAASVGECFAVAINSQHARLRRSLKERFAVPAKTQRCVHKQPAALWR